MQSVGREALATLVFFLAVAGCGPAVNEGQGGEGGADSEGDASALVGRYGVYFSDERMPLFMGDVILEEGGGGEFLPEWACDEDVRGSLRWTLEERDGGGKLFELAAEDGPGQQGDLRISGALEGCFDEALDGEFGALRSRVLLLPNDGYCLDEISDSNGAWSEEGCLVESCGELALPGACVVD